ncbi:hypothetical protein AGR4C_Lc80149 [Agrobacterium tumefaciens str. Kerr 14]|uniref:Uncharacterized protein n=1 Tax=Agrobacterium tumefaciens str. Kerr 14 TaxID=1183424 RepID=A0A1S7S4X8_AGRTU|nr:hypothetical protein AGR4C_Lc80149 [Agrobacterium tumefaciens str. Kerr 14]
MDRRKCRLGASESAHFKCLIYVCFEETIEFDVTTDMGARSGNYSALSPKREASGVLHRGLRRNIREMAVRYVVGEDLQALSPAMIRTRCSCPQTVEEQAFV